MDNAYAGFLAGPTSIKLTTAWQRFKITGTLAGGQTGLWIFVRQFAGKSRYARTSASPTAFVVAGVACGATGLRPRTTRSRPSGYTVSVRTSRTTGCLKSQAQVN